MWFAPLPVLVYALRSRAWSAGLVAFAAMLAGCLNLWSYLRILGSAADCVVGHTCGMIALVFALGVLLMRALTRRGAVWSAWVALPAVRVAFEYVRNLALWPHGSGGSSGVFAAELFAVSAAGFARGAVGDELRAAAVSGRAGAGTIRWGAERGQAVRLLGATAGVVAAVLIFGAVRLAGRQPGPEVRVGLVASDVSRGVTDPGEPAQKLFEEYAQRAQELAARGARVVVMPEDLAVIVDPNVAGTDAIFQPIADRTGAMLVIGVNHVQGALHYNEARIYTPGAAVRSYDKEHLLPPFETRVFTPGTARTLFAAPGGAGQTWGVAICKDLDFTEPARGYGRAGVGLLMAPAWDFQVDAFWHGHIAVMRAVEDGFSLVRSARGGFMTVADDRGRILAETRSNSAPFATMLATVPVGHDETLFQLWGDWFGWCAVVLLVLVVARPAVKRRG